MGTVRVEIKTDNAAFENPMELAHILEDLASRVRDTGHLADDSIRDSNGNRVGQVTVEE